MLVDANILLYAVDDASPFHARAKSWLESALNGDRRVGIPWQSYWAFLRIATNPRALDRPLTPAAVSRLVEEWLAASTTWVPQPSTGHFPILARLLEDNDVRGALVADAVLAAICIEHGLTIVSNDSDFARFPEVPWFNPLAA